MEEERLVAEYVKLSQRVILKDQSSLLDLSGIASQGTMVQAPIKNVLAAILKTQAEALTVRAVSLQDLCMHDLPGVLPQLLGVTMLQGLVMLNLRGLEYPGLS